MKKQEVIDPVAEKVDRYRYWNVQPLCFPSRAIYDEWRHYSKIASEVCTICDDCSKEYKYRMKEEKLCEGKIWKQIKFNQTEKSKG